MINLTSEHFSAMSAIQNGADLYSYATALRLREVQSLRPEWVSIGAAKNPPSGEKQQPYFGAILTDEGVAALENHK